MGKILYSSPNRVSGLLGIYKSASIRVFLIIKEIVFLYLTFSSEKRRLSFYIFSISKNINIISGYKQLFVYFYGIKFVYFVFKNITSSRGYKNDKFNFVQPKTRPNI